MSHKIINSYDTYNYYEIMYNEVTSCIFLPVSEFFTSCVDIWVSVLEAQRFSSLRDNPLSLSNHFSPFFGQQKV